MIDLGEIPTQRTPQPLPGTMRRVSTNTLQLAAGRFVAQVLLVVFTILVARRMGEEGLGAYAFMAAVIFIGNVVTTFGTDTLIMREVAAHRDFSHLVPSLVIQLILSALFIASLLIFSGMFPVQNLDETWALFLYSLSLFPMAIFSVASAALRGMELMAPFIWLNLTLAGLQTILAWWLIQPDSSLVELSLVLLFVQVVAAFLSAGFIWYKIPELRGIREFRWIRLTHLVSSSTPLALIAGVKIIFQKITIIFTGYFLGAAVTGWFSAASRMVEATQIGHIALLGALFPVMSYTYTQGSEITAESKRTLKLSLWLLPVLGLAIAILLFFLAQPLVHLVFGSGFEPSVDALRILAWLMVPYSFNLYLSTALISSRKDRQVLIVFVASLVLLVALDFLWIPKWGLTGACLATLISETIQCGLFIFVWISLPKREKIAD